MISQSPVSSELVRAGSCSDITGSGWINKTEELRTIARESSNLERDQPSKSYGREENFCMNSDVQSGAIGRQQMERFMISYIIE